MFFVELRAVRLIFLVGESLSWGYSGVIGLILYIWSTELVADRPLELKGTASGADTEGFPPYLADGASEDSSMRFDSSGPN